LVEATKEVIWIERFYKELGFAKLGPMDIYCANQSLIKISHNLVYHSKTKYSEIHLNCVKDMVEKKEVKISYVPIERQPINILTKALGYVKFENCFKLFNPFVDFKLENLTIQSLRNIKLPF
jgi:hypothetical protein